MEFDCYISAKFSILDEDMKRVVEQLREDWAPEEIELFPQDLITTAKKMGIGKLIYDRRNPNIECDEPALTEEDIPVS